MTLGLNGFEDLQREIDKIANGFEEMSRRHERETVRGAIEEGVTNAFDDIVDDAKRKARRIGLPSSHVTTIDHASDGWRGDTYRHEMGSPSVIIASHEFGSGIHSLNGRGTVDVPGEGYIIPKPVTSGPVRIPLSQANVDPDELSPKERREGVFIVEYTIHPGVKPKRFMHEAVQEGQSKIRGHVGSQLSRLMREKDITD